MDLQHLRDSYPKLLAHLEENGYSASYVSRIRREINRILSKAGSKNWESYRDIYLDYAETCSPSYLRDRRTCLGLIEHFDVCGQYPDGRRRQKIVLRGQYYLLVDEFKAVIDRYCAAEKVRGKKERTIYGEACSGASFLFALQENGIDTLEKITEEAVLAVFLSPEHELCRSCSYKKNIEAVFKACVPQNPEVFTKILAFLPVLRETRKNIQYLRPEEVARLKQSLADEKSPLSLRDRAVGTLALYTGLRCCDIAGLPLDAVDFENDRLRISQQKTGVPLELPLTAIVGNAIWDYLRAERPETDCEHVFVTVSRPYRRLESGSIGNISNKLMQAAGIRQRAGERGGFHIFRHHLATRLLGSGVPQPVVSRALGHTSPDSLETYLSADFKHLKECALSVERFPVPEGVFGNA